jgi:hypothetical protein
VPADLDGEPLVVAAEHALQQELPLRRAGADRSCPARRPRAAPADRPPISLLDRSRSATGTSEMLRDPVRPVARVPPARARARDPRAHLRDVFARDRFQDPRLPVDQVEPGADLHLAR